MQEEIVGEDGGTAKEKVPNGGGSNRFTALFTRPIGMHVSLDRFNELDLCRGYLGKSTVSRGERL